jgi:uncharacterized membrane protein
VKPGRNGGWLVLLIAPALGYALVAHLLTTAREPGALGALASLAPWALLALAVAWRSAHRVLAFAASALLAALAWRYWDALEHNTAWMYYLQHIAMFIALGAAFALTLRSGREALCTRFARAVEGALSPGATAYTRVVTLAWAAFCAAMAAASTLLFFFAPLPAWSVFANLLTLPLVGAMFLAESVVRVRACPELAHHGVLGGVVRSVRAYWDDSARPTPGPR